MIIVHLVYVLCIGCIPLFSNKIFIYKNKIKRHSEVFQWGGFSMKKCMGVLRLQKKWFSLCGLQHEKKFLHVTLFRRDLILVKWCWIYQCNVETEDHLLVHLSTHHYFYCSLLVNILLICFLTLLSLIFKSIPESSFKLFICSSFNLSK